MCFEKNNENETEILYKYKNSNSNFIILTSSFKINRNNFFLQSLSVSLTLIQWNILRVDLMIRSYAFGIRIQS
ncbi:hypothetical protein BpHYR1_022403 [Brachionus plicatilis]|uniref:Uncharacterized protein n=1 Tax=Brachionus plicatilis TaxID=10195 RepID=A0A3M7RCH7_BRAPC|nr:hypothetical protein BpHYR1_022403 [Brachionus plicatilis]